MFNEKRKKPFNSIIKKSSSGLMSDNLLRKHRPDYLLIILATLLSVIGLIVVYSISPGLVASKNVDENYFVIKQATSVVLGFIAFSIFSYLSIHRLKKFKNVLVALCIIGVLAVQFFGEEVNGAYRWIQIGGLSFQVAELLKFALIIWVASFLIDRMQRGEMHDFNKTLRPLMIVLAIVGIVVAFMESDLGSTGVMVAILGVMAFVAGLPLKKIALIVGIVALGTVLAVSTSSYRRERVATFLNPTSDCQDAGYQACQALIAVGSGGVVGKGLGNSVQAYGYLPEPQNDSIFAILAEKFGFLGVSFVIAIYLALFSRLKRVIERTADPFSRLFVVGVLAWLSIQTMINVGAMIGMFPLKGITLPFISYGGTSILFVMAALGVVSHISRYTSFEPIRNSSTTIKGKDYDNRSVRERVRRPYYATSGRR
jgi:cell division protein FtsW